MGKYRELAAAIRKGIPHVTDRKIWLVDKCGCALATALYAMGHKEVLFHEEVYGLIEKHFGVAYYIANNISRKHTNGQTREQIADWLDTLEPRISDAEFTARFISEVVESVKSQEVAEFK